MVGRNDRNLDSLIEDVSRGRRDLGSIRDPKVREAVRIALRLHREAPAAPDAYARTRMRARVLRGLEPRRPSLADHAWTALELLAKPAPYIVRGLALASLLVAAGLGATVASADTLPEDLLYPLKLASEQVRLALADAPEDRAAVELSMAEHRLREAERLAIAGRTSDALVASAVYSQLLASAAADLAPVDAASDLTQQLETRFDAQRERAATLATTLAANTTSAGAAKIIALIAQPTMATGKTAAERVASTAVGVVSQLALVAEDATLTQARTVDPSPHAVSASPTAPSVVADTRRILETPRASAKSGATAAAQPSLPSGASQLRVDASASATARPNESATPGRSDHANEVLRAVRKALEQTRAAAERAKKSR